MKTGSDFCIQFLNNSIIPRKIEGINEYQNIICGQTTIKFLCRNLDGNGSSRKWMTAMIEEVINF
ncbi:MAG: hypothetical protein A2460_02645 [Omnitrophica WOR_2 bacterium RIFOXYC2_FULL_43_9]|nr:MAG: hypothetical protein A2460_02645 [Omnitrophica WOR_2 bacterium RIFOXYC2_FULL_43_9]